jgi:hypothetical protein
MRDPEMPSFRPIRGGGASERPRPWRSPHGFQSFGVDWPRRAFRQPDGGLKPDPIILGIIITLVVLAALIGRDPGEQRAVVHHPLTQARNDALELSPFEGWAATARTPRLEGMGFVNPVVLEDRVSGTRLVAGMLPVTSSTLLPSGFVRRTRAVVRPEISELGQGVEAYHYVALAAAGAHGLVDVYAVPTTAGVATIACVAGPGNVWPDSDCSRTAATLKLRRGRALRLGPDAAFRQRLPAAILALEDARQRARAQLATRVPERQAAAASELATAYQAQGAALAPLAPASRPRSRELVRELAGAGRAYRAVVSALKAADAAAFRERQHAVHASERRIDQLVELPGNE